MHKNSNLLYTATQLLQANVMFARYITVIVPSCSDIDSIDFILLCLAFVIERNLRTGMYTIPTIRIIR